MKPQRLKNQLTNFIIPAFVFGALTGVLTSLTVTLYKLCAHHVIAWSAQGYEWLSRNLVLIPVVLLALLGIAWLLAFAYKKIPNLQGGGIPTSIGILRGILSFHWLKNLLGIFFLSMTTFLLGVPLGNEGPAVQMGTAVGRGTVYSFAKKHRAWDRYSMTGGACAGFATATGAPVCGILFAIEEAHQRISPMIVLVSATSVMFARITTELVSPLCGVSVQLFPSVDLPALQIGDIWIPVAVGLTIGFFAVLFLILYRHIFRFFSKLLQKIPHAYRIFSILVVTLVLGLCSFSFVSTGHDLILELYGEEIVLWMLLLLLLFRSVLTLSANANGITGGLFVPVLALGALIASILGKLFLYLPNVGQEQYTVILVLGITACIAGMMKTPLIAVLFAVEALGCYENILYVIVTAAFAYAIPELFGVVSVNDSVLERRTEQLMEKGESKVIDTFVTVQKGAFAVGKQIRDIFWPANLFVLSLKHDEKRRAEVDEHGGKEIREGDILHVRYSTRDESVTREELTAIVGKQVYQEKETDII